VVLARGGAAARAGLPIQEDVTEPVQGEEPCLRMLVAGCTGSISRLTLPQGF
jgi:hypothetical protein